MNRTILIVEDDVDYQDQVSLHLRNAGFGVLTAATRQEAMEIFAERKPDLAVVDLMLQNMDDGFVLCYQFKKMAPATPLIIVTAVGKETGIDFDVTTPEDRSWIKADTMLQKPVRFETLHSEIDRLLAVPAQAASLA